VDERPREAPPTTEPELVRLPPRRNVPIAVAVAIVAFLGLVIWAPWGRDDGSATDAGPTARETASPDAARASLPTTTEPASPSPLPESPTADPVAAVTLRTYQSITDNEWTIVALLTSGAGPSTEEPALQHVPLPAPSADGPFVVIQQGVIPSAAPLERSGQAAATCSTTPPPRDQRVVHLPSGRVVYVGVTFPGMDRTARVEALALGGPRVALHQAMPVAVELAGMAPGVRYAVPAWGPGGTLLFRASPTTRLPSAPYRFELRIPGIAGPRFVYACIDG
jgi:hypothetical protein